MPYRNGATRNMIVASPLICSVVLVCSLGDARGQDVGPFEVPPVFRASEAAAGVNLEGPNYRIDDLVYNGGFDNRYSISTSYGTSIVESYDGLRVRVHELNAIYHMQQVQGTSTYANSLKTAAMGPLKTAGSFLVNPVDATVNVISGVGRFLGGIGDSLTSFGRDDDNVLEALTGFAATKRKFAFEYGIDPYSRYEPLQSELKKMAWAGFAGGMTVTAAFIAIPGALGSALQISGTAGQMAALIRDNTPAELDRINGSKLRRMGVHDSLASAFLRNPNFSPTHKTYLAGALESMSGVEERQLFIQLATVADSEELAFYWRRQAEMGAAYHTKISPVKSFGESNGVPFMQRRDGVIVGVFPVDYISWTQGFARLNRATMEDVIHVPGVTGGELWFLGGISEMTRHNLTAQGWVIFESTRARLGLN